MIVLKLVITEKPSVANEIAKVIGANKRETGFLSNENYIVTWCVGHLVQLSMPEKYNPDFKKWDISYLPIIPDKWIYEITENTKIQFNTVRKLMNKNEVDKIICATDAGREGELIFRLVYNQSHCNKPVQRLWINSMETESIKTGFANLEDSSNYDNLYNSALARLYADWLVGINYTRLFSCLYKNKLNIGRVQTPTINLIVNRQNEINNFKPEEYYTITADCSTFKATKRVSETQKATEIIKLCKGKKGIIKDIQKNNHKENAPSLYDLTTLQRDSNKILGLSAQRTLDIVQNLYEKKLVTYPRTDSRFLTSEMEIPAKELIDKIIKSNSIDIDTKNIYKTDAIVTKKIIDDKKVSDHHAIIVTNSVINIPNDLSKVELQILNLILYRFLISVYIPFEFSKTNITLLIENEEFKVTGKTILNNGFKEIQNNLFNILKHKPEDDESNSNNIIPDLKENDTIDNIIITSKKMYTKPPKPYTEDTLLSAMENAIKTIENENFKKSNASLGTPATRAGIIEKIISTGFIERNNKNLIPTQKAYDLIAIVPEKVKSPELTAEWEKLLEEIYKGDLNFDDFMNNIKNFINDTTNTYKTKVPDTSKFNLNKQCLGICPRCGKPIYESKSNFYCESGKSCGFSLWKNDKFFTSKKVVLTNDIVEKLLKNEKVKLTNLYSSKKNTKYSAYISIKDTGKYINYEMEFINNK